MKHQLLSLKNYLSSFHELHPKEWDFIASHVELQSFDKKEYLTLIGEKVDYIDFVTEGNVRIFFLSPDNREISIDFSFASQPVLNLCMTPNSRLSEFHVQALSPTQTLRIKQIHHEYLEKNFVSYQKRKLKVIGHQLNSKVLLQKNLLSLNAEENYQRVIAEKPEIIKQIPVKDIASYLGIHPESLSRIRKNLV
jgi:CRP-like cAMP-binding protein